MNTQDTELKLSVMRRVRFIYYVRLLARPFVLEGVIFLGAAVTVVLSVSIPDIVSNFYRLEMTMYSGYLADAFMHTHHIVQATVVLITISGALLIKSSLKSFGIIGSSARLA